MEETLSSIGFHIDLIRESLGEQSDDTEIGDLVIYAAMVDIRAMLIDQEITKRKEIDEMYYQTICMDLCKDNYARCCTTFNLNKQILRSKKSLPEYITHKYLRPLIVTTVDGENVVPYQRTTDVKWDKYWDIEPMMSHDITNFNNTRHLIINGNLDLPGVLVTGAFIDPAGAVLQQSCDEEISNCADWKDVLFPLPSKLRQTFYQMTMQRVAMRKELPTDVANDSQSSTKQI